MTLRPLADVLLDLIDLATAIIDRPFAAFGHKADVAAINEEIVAWVAKPSDARIADDVEIMLVCALAHAADPNQSKDKIQDWCDIAEGLLTKVRKHAKLAVEETQRVPG